MIRFNQIDKKLTELTIKLNAIITKDRPNFIGVLNTFEERRIDWIDNQIRKAIIIQPNFELNGVNSNFWNFVIVAWIEKNGIAIKPGWNKRLIDNGKFNDIENNIDELLSSAVDYLKKIKLEDVN